MFEGWKVVITGDNEHGHSYELLRNATSDWHGTSVEAFLNIRCPLKLAEPDSHSYSPAFCVRVWLHETRGERRIDLPKRLVGSSYVYFFSLHTQFI